MWTETMPRPRIRAFLRDERGSYTIWSIFWFMLYAFFGGLAVDVTDAYRNQTLLQSTADSAALAAVMSVDKPGENPVGQANDYAAANMNTGVNGDVLANSDIKFGNYDFDARTFTANAAPTNAVHVITRRAVDNGNPVSMNFLRILALVGFNPIWNVAAEAIAVQGVSTCHNNGLIALGEVTQTNQNEFYNNICVHGGDGLVLRNDDYFQSGVAVSTTCYDCVGPDGQDPSENEGWDEAWWRGGENEPLYPLNALVVGEYADVLKALPDMADYSAMVQTHGTNYAGWRYLFKDDGSPPDVETVKTLPDVLLPHTVYMLDCKGGNQRLPETPMRNLAIVSGCTIKVNPNDNLDMVNVAIVADFESNSPGISIAGKGSFGDRNCGDLGMVELYTTGSDIHFAAKGDVNSVRLISAGDIDWAAKANGRVGIMAEAMGDIKMTTQAEFGLCPNDTVNGPNQYTYRLVY